MIIFYPPANPISTPIVIADLTDSSDRWSPAEIALLVFKYIPKDMTGGGLAPPLIYSCKYNYEIQHNGSPIGSALKMTLDASIKVPPSDLISQVSISYLSSALSPGALADSLIANPQMNTMFAVIVEKINFTSNLARTFIAYSSVLQPDPLGTTATLVIKGASIDDTLIRSVLGFQLDKIQPLTTQIAALASQLGYTLFTEATEAYSPPVNEILFQPSTLPKILDEICLQNKLIYTISGDIISLYSQTSEPFVSNFITPEFSFIGARGNVMWGVGVENYANVKFKTAIFDVSLFSKIVLYDDSNSGVFTGLKKNIGLINNYDMIILRYLVMRNDYELCCEITATNNWLLSQMRVEGIMESKIYEGL